MGCKTHDAFENILEVDYVGAAAVNVLDSGSVAVAAAFAHSFYIENAAGDLACVLGPGVEPGPLHVVCRRLPPSTCAGIREGMALVRDGSRLHDGRLSIEMGRQSIWEPEPYPRYRHADFERGLSSLADSLAGVVPADACLTLLSTPTDNSLAASGDLAAIIRKEVENGIRDLRAWLMRPHAAPGPESLSLLGLGPGLTPTGDDILAGVLLTLNAVEKRPIAKMLGAALMPLSRERTNRISRAHLMQAAEGRGAKVFHDVVRTMLAGGGDYSALIARIAAVGHTSGWDALAGILLASAWILEQGI